MCDSKFWASMSHDALAFNFNYTDTKWGQHLLERLAFAPYLLHAENNLACHLGAMGVHIYNPCHDTGLTHNHCTNNREHSGDVKGASGLTSIKQWATNVTLCRGKGPSIRRNSLRFACADIERRANLLNLTHARLQPHAPVPETHPDIAE